MPDTIVYLHGPLGAVPMKAVLNPDGVTYSLATSAPGGGAGAITGPLGRGADAAGVSVALSTEDMAALGLTTDAAVITDANGSVNAHVRGLIALWLAGLKAGEAHLGEVGGNLISIATEFTRPADTTAYAANDVVSDSISATTMQPLANAARVSGGSGYIVGIRATTDKKSIVPRVRVHFFNTNGATLAADNVAWKEVYADASKRVGSWDMPAMSTGADTTNSDMSRSLDLAVRIPYTCAATSLYYVLETLDAFTPASGEKLTVTIYVDRN